ncbi:MAG: ribosome recycling factor [Bacillota bacterium]|nr:ribosome recycling factor [Bacillota bacterium]
MRFEVHNELEERMEKTVHVLKSEFASVRTGKATPRVLDSIYVEYYGADTPLNQLASITTPEPRTLMIKPFDKSVLATIEKSILTSDLGINPGNDGDKIILNFPMLTEERRKDFSKIVKSYAEEAKVALRNERRDANDKLKKMEKNGDITEDDLRSSLSTVEDIIHKYNATIDELCDKKVNDIMLI